MSPQDIQTLITEGEISPEEAAVMSDPGGFARVLHARLRDSYRKPFVDSISDNNVLVRMLKRRKHA